MSSEQIQPHHFYLEPGYIYCATRPAQVHTVLGTCVAVCLWDRVLRFGGMNHFLLPQTTNQEEATPRYGNVATLELVNLMERAGSKRHNMLAHLVGGGRPIGFRGATLGEENIGIAKATLKRKGIRLGSEDVGGHMGRKVVFDTGTGHLMVLKVHKLRESDWLATGY